MNVLLWCAVTTPLTFPPVSTNPICSEVTRTVPLVVDAARLDSLTFTLDLTPDLSSNLEIGIGCDADGDGELALLEADYTFGVDCGEWFVADTETGEVAPHPSNTWTIARKDFKPGWNALRLTRRGTGEMFETVTTTETHTRFILSIR